MLGHGRDLGPRGCAGGVTEPISLYRTSPSRSPSGLLNPNPAAPRAVHDTPSGWAFTGCAEFGILAGGNDEGSALMRTYRDLGGHAIVDTIRLGADHAGEARFLEAYGSALGRSDAHHGVRLGRYNDWTLSAFYNATPHVHTSSYRSLWSGVGSASLALQPGLVPGGQPTADESRASILGALE